MNDEHVPDTIPDAEPEPEPRYESGHLPPQDLLAERAVLGAMLISKSAIAEAVEASLFGSDYYRPSHEQIHDTILDLDGRGEPVDMVTVATAMQRDGILTKVGGAAYLHTLASEVHTAANAGTYARAVKEKAVLRRVVEAAVKIRQRAMEAEGDVDLLVDWAQSEMLSAVPASSGNDYRPMYELIPETLDAIEESIGAQKVGLVPTGLIDLDALLGGGWLPGQMIVVAGRPALGKSTLAMDFARAAAVHNNLTTAVFSLEMTRSEITMRLMSAEAKVPLANLRDADRLTEDDWRRIAGIATPLMNAPLFIDDSANLTMTEIRTKARRLKQTEDLKLVVIDYLQLMTSGKAVESRQVEVSEFSRQIKLLAKELEVPVIALSQLNRGPEQRSSKRPMMSDLRESGSIEQDCDIAILLHRDDAYEVESSRPGEADLIIAKHRNGATRDIAVAAQLHYSRFADLAHV